VRGKEKHVVQAFNLAVCALLQLLGYLKHVHINVNGNSGMLTYLPWSTLPKLERSENPVTVEGAPYCLQIQHVMLKEAL
jgi:hypothetical protein